MSMIGIELWNGCARKEEHRSDIGQSDTGVTLLHISENWHIPQGSVEHIALIASLHTAMKPAFGWMDHRDLVIPSPRFMHWIDAMHQKTKRPEGGLFPLKGSSGERHITWVKSLLMWTLVDFHFFIFYFFHLDDTLNQDGLPSGLE